MRAILASLLLLIMAVLIYHSVAEGESGMKSEVNHSGRAISEHVRSMSP